MEKYDIAMYLVNLHTLTGAQESNGRKKSQWIIEEYDYYWNLLQEKVTDEARIRAQQSGSDAPGDPK